MSVDSVAALKLQSGLVRHQSRGNSSDAEENTELEVAEIQMSREARLRWFAPEKRSGPLGGRMLRLEVPGRGPGERGENWRFVDAVKEAMKLVGVRWRQMIGSELCLRGPYSKGLFDRTDIFIFTVINVELQLIL